MVKLPRLTGLKQKKLLKIVQKFQETLQNFDLNKINFSITLSTVDIGYPPTSSHELHYEEIEIAP